MNKKIIQNYIQNGVVNVQMKGKSNLNKLKSMLLLEINKHVEQNIKVLEDFHKFCPDDIKEDLTWKLSEIFWSSDFYDKYIQKNYSIFQSFIGSGFYVQARPFLRFSRPNRPDDNIGFHRDTVYNQSPHELSIHVPLVDLNNLSCMKFIPKSHVMPDSAFIFRDAVEISKKSKKHKMGFPWLQKSIVDDGRMVPFPVDFGQAMFFSPSTVHGQEQNLSTKTRVSFDFRVVTEYAPDDLLRENRNSNYKLFVRSPVAEVAKLYEEIK